MEQLFGSKTRVKLLQLFVSNPNRPFYVREITRKVDEQINSVRRELANLLNIGFLKSKTQNNRLYYEVNQKYEHYEPLRMMFAETKAEAGGGVTSANKTLQTQLRELGHVDLLVYMGGFTQDNLTGADVLIVGDTNRTKVNNFVAELEDEEGREISFVVMTPDEFKYRHDINDRFIGLVEGAKKSVVHDPHGWFTPKKTTTATKGKKKKGK